MNNIFQTLLYQREKQKDAVLVTIVWDDGSAPRGKGSQMLVGEDGLLSGTIGGIADSYMAKSRAKSLDAKLAKATKWVGAVFIVLTLVINCML